MKDQRLTPFFPNGEMALPIDAMSQRLKSTTSPLAMASACGWWGFERTLKHLWREVCDRQDLYSFIVDDIGRGRP